MYIAEVSPLEHRGVNGTFVQLSIVVGILLSAIVGIPFSTRQSWRDLFAIALIPVLLQMIFIPFVPESPFWLVMQNQDDHARASLQQVRGGQDVEEELQDIVKALRGFNHELDEDSLLLHTSVKQSIGFNGIFKDKTLWRPLISAMGLQIIQQCNLSDFHNIISFAGLIDT